MAGAGEWLSLISGSSSSTGKNILTEELAFPIGLKLANFTLTGDVTAGRVVCGAAEALEAEGCCNAGDDTAAGGGSGTRTYMIHSSIE